MEKLSKANYHFTLDLFRELIKGNQVGNIFFSPFSISTALAMVYLGAKNNSASQMAKTLHFDDVGDLHSAFQKMQLEVNRADVPYLLKMASRLYGEKSYKFLEEFCKSSENYYGAALSAVDFRASANETRQEINKWVEEQTAGKIQDLLAAGSVNSDTKLVLVNAIYFKGSWAEKFDEQCTQEMPFRLNKNESKPVQMMYKSDKFLFRHIPEVNIKVLELPYVEKDVSMVILLPDDIMDDSTGLEKRNKGMMMLETTAKRKQTDRATLWIREHLWRQSATWTERVEGKWPVERGDFHIRDIFSATVVNYIYLSGHATPLLTAPVAPPTDRGSSHGPRYKGDWSLSPDLSLQDVVWWSIAACSFFQPIKAYISPHVSESY
ncbi:leukocyte elastase inhibitor-like isoform X2 [Hemitrygon akajei]|uniref:leukocyte elastase inhibitor-like isoform X2 n=1 Tax=Hemitrygon akajei TaxID=2704970 RepID=UPI003BF95405